MRKNKQLLITDTDNFEIHQKLEGFDMNLKIAIIKMCH